MFMSRNYFSYLNSVVGRRSDSGRYSSLHFGTPILVHSKIYQLRENNLLIIKSFFVSVTIKIRYGHGVEAQKVLLLPVTSCFGAQEVLIAFALFGIIWACTISTVH